MSSTTFRRRCPQAARDSGSRRHRPHVPQRLPAPAADRPRRRRLLPLPPRRDLRLLGAHGPHQQGLHRRGRALRRAGTDPPDHLRQGPAQGRRRRGVSRSRFQRHRGDRLRRQGPGEDAGLPHREAPQSRNRPDVPLDRAEHGHGQPLLLLRHRRGLRPVLPQVLHLLPLQRQALHQRPRVRQAATGQGRDRLRGPGQRRPELRQPPTTAATLRRPLGRQDRRAAAEVAGAAAAPVHRRRIARPAIATTCRSSRPSSP